MDHHCAARRSQGRLLVDEPAFDSPTITLIQPSRWQVHRHLIGEENQSTVISSTLNDLLHEAHQTDSMKVSTLDYLNHSVSINLILENNLTNEKGGRSIGQANLTRREKKDKRSGKNKESDGHLVSISEPLTEHS